MLFAEAVSKPEELSCLFNQADQTQVDGYDQFCKWTLKKNSKSVLKNFSFMQERMKTN